MVLFNADIRLGADMPMRWLGKHLMFKSDYIPLLKSGVKRSTIRIGKIEIRNKDFFINSGGKILARAVLKEVKYKKIGDLTDEDAKLDGFNSREELVNELKKHYKHVTDDTIVTIIVFDIVEWLNIDEYGFGRLKPREISELALKHLPLSEYEEMIHRKIIEYGSIRRTAKALFGSLKMRWKIRNVLNKAYQKLVEKGLIKLD
jgi:hypothetical protein